MQQRSLFLCLPFLLLSACGGVLPEARNADRMFVLNAPEAQQNTAAPVAATLEVALPQAAPGLDTERIALLKDSHEIDYYSEARWAETLPLMTQSLLVESFEHQGTIRAVGNDVIGLAPDLRLLVELRHFEAVYAAAGSAPEVRVQLVAKLFSEPGHRLLSSTTYEEKAAANENALSGIIPAFDMAFSKAATALVNDAARFAAENPLPATPVKTRSTH